MIDWDSCVLWLDSRYFSESKWWDRSKYNNDGIVHKAVFKEDAFEFNAGDDYIDLPIDIVFDDEMSIEIVFELYDDTDAGRVIGSQHSSGSNYELRTYIQNSNLLYFFVGNGSSTPNVYFYLDNWFDLTHGIWTWEYDSGADETTLKAYKDGTYKSSIIFDGKVQLPNINLRLGHWENTLGMNGKIYLARFYHKVLSDDEIKLLARNTEV